MKYPFSKRNEHIIDNYFGTNILDPYRWLEDDHADDTLTWVNEQNKFTRNYIDEIPFRNDIKNKLTELWNYPKEGAPFRIGDNYIYAKNNGLQNQSVWYIKHIENGIEEVLLDPNEISKGGTAAVSLVGFSKNKKYLAYSIAQSGSDWNTIYVIDLITKQTLEDEIKWTKFSGAAWYKNGFYYSRYDEPSAKSKLSASNTFQKVYYHTLGNNQSEDILVFENTKEANLYFSANVNEDETFLTISVSQGTSGNAIYYKNLIEPASEIKILIEGYENNHHVIGVCEDEILVLTDLNALNSKLVAINSKTNKWRTVISEQELSLQTVSYWGGYIWAEYLINASSSITQYNISGEKISQVKLPELGTVNGFDGFKTDLEIYYTFTNFTTPGTIYKYNLTNGTTTLYKESAIQLDLNQFETNQIFYPSKDGTMIPMFIVYKKGIKLDGNNPLLMYAYGGFQVNLTPTFSLSRMLFLENGGIYVQPNLRGGAEFGEQWHKAGMLENKQNVFDDFIAAAEYLINNNYTNSNKLAISGGSNGGLLVAACMTQRPELFKVALPAVGVLDMLRYHKFTVGWGWIVEYGSSENKEQFDYLLKYSPLHNLKHNVSYPATLVTTADHDDRVVPAHSFKFAATLQEKNTGKNIHLIRIEQNAGHGAGKPTVKLIDEAADVWSFIFYNLGIEYQKPY